MNRFFPLLLMASVLLGCSKQQPSSSNPKDDPVIASEVPPPAEPAPDVPAPPPRDQFSADDWAFIPRGSDWTDRFGFVDPRATIETEDDGVLIKVDPPLPGVALVYRKRLSGDFAMELDVERAPAPRGENEPGKPNFLSVPINAIKIEDPNQRSSGRRLSLNALPWAGKRSSEDVTTLKIRREGNKLFCSDGESELSEDLGSTDSGYLMLECSPAVDYWKIKHTVLDGKTEQVGFEKPQMSSLAIDADEWTSAALNASDGGDKITKEMAGESLLFSSQLPGVMAMLQWDKKLHGDFLLMAKIGTDLPKDLVVVGMNRRQTQVNAGLRDATSEQQTRGMMQVAVGDNACWITMTRSGDAISSRNDGYPLTASKINGPVLFNLQTNRTDFPIRVEELYIHADKIEDVMLTSTSAGGWTVDPEAYESRPLNRSKVSVSEDGDRVKVENHCTAKVVRSIQHDGDFQVTWTIVQPPREYFSDAGIRPQTVSVLIGPDGQNKSTFICRLPRPLAGKESAHQLTLRREGKGVRFNDGNKETGGRLEGPVRIALQTSFSSRYWVADYAEDLAATDAGATAEPKVDRANNGTGQTDQRSRTEKTPPAQNAAATEDEKPDPRKQLRTWKSKDGKYSVEASFGGLLTDKVILKTPAGRKINVPIDMLSEQDREFIRQLKR